MQHGKKYKGAFAKIDPAKIYSFTEAIAFLKAHPMAKFDEAVEVHLHLGINIKKSDEAVRGTVILPHGTGRVKKLAIVTSTKVKEAKDAGATLVGGEELIDDIKTGKLAPGRDFEVVLATPEMMPKLAQVAKILGPKGMMPSPKTETVTQKIGEAVEMLGQGKKVNFKNDDTANLHQVIGKLSFDAMALEENLSTFVQTIEKAKPEGLKGKFMVSITLKTTMGPGLKVSRAAQAA